MICLVTAPNYCWASRAEVVGNKNWKAIDRNDNGRKKHGHNTFSRLLIFVQLPGLLQLLIPPHHLLCLRVALPLDSPVLARLHSARQPRLLDTGNSLLPSLVIERRPRTTRGDDCA